MSKILHCRLCASETPEYDLIDIFNNKNNNLVYKIVTCLQVNVTENDILPKQTCVDCETKLYTYYTFHQQVRRSQQLLDHLYKTTPKEENWCDDYGCSDDGYGQVDIKDIKEEENEFSNDFYEMRTQFYDGLNQLRNGLLKKLFTEDNYNTIINQIEKLSTMKRGTSKAIRRYADRYEIYTVNGTKRLIARRTKKNKRIRLVVPRNEVFELIHNFHVDMKHTHQNRVSTILRQRYANITRELVLLYAQLCPVCKERKKGDEDEPAVKRIRASANEYDWKCKECSELFSTPGDLQSHFRAVHKKPTQYICTDCLKVYDSYIPFRVHLRRHRDKFRYRCEYCDTYYSSNRKLREHKQRHSKSRHKYVCSHCGASFLHQVSLMRHERRVHSEMPEKPKETVKKVECDICHKLLASIQSMKTHRKIHTNAPEHTCEHCGKSFVFRQYLEDHIVVHTNERPFKCDQCSHTFKSKVYLRRHQFLHTGKKPHKCDICGKHFSYKSGLQVHSIIHTDLRPFKCDMCDKCFRYKKNLLKHHQTSHPWATSI